MKRMLGFFLLFSLLSSVIPTSTVPLMHAQQSGCTITQLTDNTIHDWAPMISEGRVVWVSGLEIFLYANNVVTQITNDGEHDAAPRIAGDLIVWVQSRPVDGTASAFLYNISSGTTRELVANAMGPEVAVDANEGQAAWVDRDDQDSEIFLYDGSSTIQLTDNTENDRYPEIDDGQVVWMGEDGQDSEIFLYDGSSTIQLTDNTEDDMYPRIDNGQVVWANYRNGDNNTKEIFLYDGSTTIQLTNNTWVDWSHVIGNGYVVWPGGEEGNNEIFLYDIAAGTITQLTDNKIDDIVAQIDGSQIIWWSITSDGDEISLYDITTGTTVQVTKGPVNGVPRINNGQIVWAGTDGNDTEIFLATCGSTAP